MEHLANCHGEWSVLFAAIASLPFVATYVKAVCNPRHNCKQKQPNTEGK